MKYIICSSQQEINGGDWMRSLCAANGNLETIQMYWKTHEEAQNKEWRQSWHQKVMSKARNNPDATFVALFPNRGSPECQFERQTLGGAGIRFEAHHNSWLRDNFRMPAGRPPAALDN